MAKSSHRGHCQACGRLQMLPCAFLSKHGYNMAHGYFSGVCVGAGHQPFEESCALVAEFIRGAKAALSTLEEFRAELRKPVTEPLAWVHNFEGGTDLRTKHVWRQVTLLDERGPHGADMSYFANGTQGQVNVRQGHTTYNYGQKDVLVEAQKANSKYADWLGRQAGDLKRYIAWQTERVATWKPMPLFPVDAKDKAGFVPTAGA